MRELKKSSSAWVHNEIGLAKFAWQEGYGAFTVSPPARGGVKQYIANQAEHHRRRTFREELVELLEQARVEYDDKWLDGAWHPSGMRLSHEPIFGGVATLTTG